MSERHRLRAERGGILVVVTILLTVVFAVVALVVDSNLAAASKEQAQHYARIAALAAIEQYIERLGKGDTHSQALAAALARAKGVSKVNWMAAQADIEPDIDTAAGAGARLEVGTWTGESAKCGGNPPCFVPWTGLGAGTPNAARVQGQFYKDGIITRLAPHILHVNKVSSGVRAVASVVPRHGIFLVDNSASMIRETHPWGTDEFAFNLTDPFQTHVWGDVVVPRGLRGAHTVDRTVHYSDDYVGVTTLGDLDFNSTFAKHHPDPNLFPRYSTPRFTYLVDRFRSTADADPANNYYGPEPLTDVFHGLNAALDTFTSRHVAGDKAGIIFYDQSLPWPRVLTLTDDFDYLKLLTEFDVPGTPPGAHKQFDLVTQYGLFPSFNANTNIELAITEAFSQLNAAKLSATAVPSADFIVLIGDGLGNCQTCRDAAGNAITSGSCASGAGCSDEYGYYKQAASELDTLVNKPGGLRETGIPLHFIEVGPSVQPHTVDRLNTDTGECFTDAEWRLVENNRSNYYGFVDDPAANDTATNYANASAGSPYYAVDANLYKWAANTQGIWGPVRPPRAKVGGVCPPIQCANGADPDLVPGSVGGTYRRVKDPLCRSLEDQIADYMHEIIADNPYTIVEVETD